MGRIPDSPVARLIAFWEELVAVVPSLPEHAGRYPATGLRSFAEG